MKYYYAANGQAVGPFSLEELRGLAAQNTIHNDTMVVCEGQSQWCAYSAVCQSPVAPTGVPIPVAPSAASVVFTDLWETVKLLAPSPAEHCATAFRRLGQERALRVGIALGLLTAVLFAGAVRLHFGTMIPGGFLFKSVLFGLIPFACFWVTSLGIRTISKREGGAGLDAYVAGVSTMPLLIAIVAGMFFSGSNWMVPLVAVAVSVSLVTLVLNSCLARVSGAPEKLAFWSTPCALLLCAWVVWLVVGAQVRDLLSGF